MEKAKDREEGGGGGGRRMDDGGHTVQLRGLPYKASEREIADWLSEAADPEDVIIIMDRLVLIIIIIVIISIIIRTGRPSGQADAIFSSERDARRVVNIMHKRDMGPRYIECFYEGDQ